MGALLGLGTLEGWVDEKARLVVRKDGVCDVRIRELTWRREGRFSCAYLS
jgi:hypothetical protein